MWIFRWMKLKLKYHALTQETGHKCESSLRSYKWDNSDEQKRQISAVMCARQDQKLTRIEPQITHNSATATIPREQLRDKLVVSGNVNCTINFNF